MKREIALVTDPIDPVQLTGQRPFSTNMGAVVHFLGIVRAAEDGRPISGLEYEAFPKMVEHQFNVIFRQIEERWPVDAVRVIHRIGPVLAGEPSLWVEMTAPHRAEAFAACQFLIDEMKKVVPIWKKPLARSL
jgi:molybdopterin synthase catalytic subunit